MPCTQSTAQIPHALTQLGKDRTGWHKYGNLAGLPTPLKNSSQLGWWNSQYMIIYGKRKGMCQSPPTSSCLLPVLNDVDYHGNNWSNLQQRAAACSSSTFIASVSISRLIFPLVFVNSWPKAAAQCERAESPMLLSRNGRQILTFDFKIFLDERSFKHGLQHRVTKYMVFGTLSEIY